MSTRSFVGVQVGEKIRAIYVHYDGYLEGVGADLQEYTTQEDVEELIADGDRGSLTKGFYKNHGEDDVEPTEFDTFEEFFDACDGSWAEWYYVFKNGVWYCGNTYAPSPLRSSKLYKALTSYEDAVTIWAEECNGDD